jgi:cyclophilin family peptidyl-prolyl cis-trans isomerase
MTARRPWLFGLALAISLAALAGGGCGKGNSGVPAAINDPKKSSNTGEAPPRVTPAGNTGESPFAAVSGQRAALSYADLHPTVVFHTSHGDITVRLDAEHAPVTVDNFLKQYVERGFYTNTVVHYVDKGVMVVAGGYDTEYKLKETRTEIQSEADNGLLNKKGTLAMARAADFAHSATSQFFFNLQDNSQFDHQSRESAQTFGYCVFGTVTKGLDVLEKISAAPTQQTEISPKIPAQPVVIQSIDVVQ